MKRLVLIVLLVCLCFSVVASAEWARQTYTYFVPGHYESCVVCVGCTYDYWGNAYPVYRYQRIWIPGYWANDVRWIWINR